MRDFAAKTLRVCQVVKEKSECVAESIFPQQLATTKHTPVLFGNRNMLAPVDVLAWGVSIDHLLECRCRLVFEDFLRTEYSEENLLFWLACEKYKKIASKTEMMGAAKQIYTEFVQVDAPRQINIDCVTREEITKNLSQPGPNCFDRAQRLIYGLMENDCYPRFLKSEIYQALLEQR
ncbi:regulator of G-protein signaling 21-like isoform X2 [Anabas testudineus]|uniref:regulator of G-protein signaling 21-like isoform X2 n=1 Tax=Anabas testudineus TaxID=64144 RepID=UPI000E457A70|nr:regulator of G-protein signaling 21-like isoform X2 [Anabas testudineus]